MRLSALPDGACEFSWEADILPINFEGFLKDSMTGALAQLIEVVAQADGFREGVKTACRHKQ